jgi:hypothetical protein
VFEPVETGTADEVGRLVFADGKLLAVLVGLSDIHEEPELQGRPELLLRPFRGMRDAVWGSSLRVPAATPALQTAISQTLQIAGEVWSGTPPNCALRSARYLCFA